MSPKFSHHANAGRTKGRRAVRALAMLAVAALSGYLLLATPGTASADPDITISGTVSTSSGTLDDQASANLVYGDGTPIDSAQINSDGTYTFDEGSDLQSGDYTITFADGVAFTPVTVDITIDGASQTGINATLDAVPLHDVTGTVTGPSNLADVDVSAYSLSDGEWEWETDVAPSADGTYSLPVPDGTYRILFEDDSSDSSEYASQVYNGIESNDPNNADGATAVTVNGAAVPGIDASLVAIPKFDVTGTVTGPADTTGVQVSAYSYDGTEWNWAANVYAAADGTYSLPLPDGSYRILFEDDSSDNSEYASQVYNNIQSDDPNDADGATTVTVNDAAVPAIDASLVKSKTISGVVDDSTGPVSAVDVQLWKWDGTEFQQTSDDATDSTGTYSLAGLTAGDYYTLFFDTSSSNTVGASVFLNGTGVAPTSTSDPSVIQFTGVADITQNYTLPDAPKATGIVTAAADGSVIANASVKLYSWDGQEWNQTRTTTTDSSGSWTLGLTPGITYTVSAHKNSFHTDFLGGGSTLPTAPNPTNSFSSTGDGVNVSTLSLQPTVSTLGKVAGEKLAYCGDNTLEADDDGSTDAVTLPFTLNFFGNAYSQLYVNNNGNVTFGNPLSTYTPTSLTGATSNPIIAPFFADVDTRADDSSLVTYGVSPDHSTFCVNWPDVGYFDEKSDKLNTFQLLLTNTSSNAGRNPGDFDITFNYDQVQWEAGDASDGTDGLGGTSAAVGFSAGTGAAGTYFQLPGSFVHGALLDGGPESLIAGDQNSTQVGRYTFEVDNTNTPISFGAIDGKVVDGNGVAQPGVDVEAFSDTHTYYTTTDNTGSYSLSGVQAGSYTVRAFPSGDLFEHDVQVDVAVATSQTPSTHAPDIVLSAPQPPASNVTVGNQVSTNAGGVPVVYYGDPIPLSISGQCPGATVTYNVSVAGATVGTGSLTAVAGHSGTYSTSIPALYPAHGAGVVSYTVTCPSAAPVTAQFDIYLDPSGEVVNQYGAPVTGASVTILASDTETGTYTAVPDGSNVLSASNRTNPSTTASDGLFSWDVQPGWYEIRISGTGLTTTTTDPMQVPPERTSLVITATQSAAVAPKPTKAPTISGTFAAGKTLTVSTGTWPAGLLLDSITWMSGTTPVGTGSTYVIQGTDVNATISAVITEGRHVDGNTDGLSAEPTTFDFPVTATVTGKKVAKGTISLSTPKLVGSPAIGDSLSVVASAAPASAVLSFQWLRSGKPITLNGTSPTYTLTLADIGKKISIKVTATSNGFTTVSKSSSSETGLKVLTTTPTPTITGTPDVGLTLTAVPGVWAPSKVTLKYQWYANGVIIKKATKSTLKLASSLVGKPITVKVTGSKSGYLTVTETSDQTADVSAS